MYFINKCVKHICVCDVVYRRPATPTGLPAVRLFYLSYSYQPYQDPLYPRMNNFLHISVYDKVGYAGIPVSVAT